jgi:hypothetical protein
MAEIDLTDEMAVALFHARERREYAEKFTSMGDLIASPTALGNAPQNSAFSTAVTIPVDHEIGFSFSVTLAAGDITFATEYQPSNPRTIGAPALAADTIHRLGPILAGRTLTPTCSEQGVLTIYAIDQWGRATTIATGTVIEASLTFTVEVTKDTGASPISATVPTGIESGDLLIMALASDTIDVNEYTTPTGWTLELESGSSNGTRLNIYSRVADGTETGTQDIAWTGTHEQVVAYYRIPGASSVEVIGTVSVTGNVSTNTTDEITTLSANSLVLGFVVTDGSLMVLDTVTAGWTTDVDAPGRATRNAAGTQLIGVSQNFPTAGLTGDLVTTYTTDTDGTRGVQIAIDPV